MTLFLLVIAVSFAVANGCILHSFDNRDIRNIGDTFFFNGGISIIWVLLLTALSLISKDFVISKGSVFYGCIYGVIICAFLLFKNLSLTSGPVSLTILIGSCPFILTTLFGVIFMKQDIGFMQIAAILLILLAVFLCISPKKGERISVKWLIFCLLFFFAGGGVGILYMLFGASDAATQINAMMLCAAVTAAILYFAAGMLFNAAGKNPMPKIHGSGVLFIIACGVASCVYMRLNVYLSTVIPSVIFFPVSNVSVVILSALSGVFLYKERLSKMQVVGMAIGLTALIMCSIT